MTRYRLTGRVDHKIDDIYLHSRVRWGEPKAKTYIDALYAEFAAIAARRRQWRPIPVAFGIDGYVHRYERHLIYWRVLDTQTIGIVAILHERMHQIDRLKDVAGSAD